MTDQMPRPIAALIEAINGLDEDAFLDAFTSDGYVDDWGRMFAGRASIAGWSRKELIGAEGHFAVESVEITRDNNVVVGGDWRSNYANGRSAFTFALTGDKVASMTIREG